MKFLGAWVSAIALFAVPAFAGQNIIRNYNTARDKFFYKKLYPHGGWTIYCGKRWRTKRGLNVEHVYPASWMAKHLGCGARRQCRTDSQRFNFMEADLHNLYPSLARINQARSNYKYSLLPNTPKFVEWCDFKVKESQETRPTPQDCPWQLRPFNLLHAQGVWAARSSNYERATSQMEPRRSR